MPYCPKCGRFYYVGTRSCSTCGEELAGQGEKTGYASGERKTVRKPERDKRCPYCNNTGKVEGPIDAKTTQTCQVCRGRRFNLIPEDWRWCKKCDGTGEFSYGNSLATYRKPCPNCKGTGWVES